MGWHYCQSFAQSDEDRGHAMSPISRRNLLAATGAAGLQMSIAATEAKAEADPQPARPGFGGTDPGPRNLMRDRQNPDLLVPPPTDQGTLPNLRFSFSDAHTRLGTGGWTRQVTVRELAVSKTIAGVDMRLNAGGIRELHWHTAAELAYMLYGSARITAIDNDGKSFVADVKESDLWYFPPGIPHSIQGLNPDGAEFLLVFDDGNFSEYATVLLSEWMAHTPKACLAQHFGVPQPALANLPMQLFAFQSAVPAPLGAHQNAAAGSRGISSQHFAFRTLQSPLTTRTKGGEVRIIDSRIFKASANIASAIVTVKPGGIRELHWHPNADEW